MPKELIMEIGAEEIPAGYIAPALDSLAASITKGLEEKRLAYGEVRTVGTPRRLTVIIDGIAEKQESATIETKGPAKKAAFDEEGKPTKALEGFARSQGLRVEELKTVSTGKGEYLYAVKSMKGEAAGKVLPELLASAIADLSFPKSMRWGAGEATFARPVHWILALFAGAPVRFTYGGVTSGAVTYGHRFMKAGGAGSTKGNGKKATPIKVGSVAEYLKKLAAAKVVVDPAVREETIRKGLEKAAKRLKGDVIEDEALVREVANLVEYPVVITGSFDKEFLDLPPAVIINAMREHQRYFSVTDLKGKLIANFITVANTDAKEEAVVRRGNERVLRARLSDAKFYFDKDKETTLAEKTEHLKDIVFQAKLGTSYEKVERFTSLALHLGELSGFSDAVASDGDPALFLSDSKYDPARYEKTESDEGHYRKLVLGRAAILSKADLTTGVVGEFPTLQGYMGGEYARLSGEAGDVAAAIADHYRPTQAGGELPETEAGALISIADKLDTICGCFSVGLLPTGTQDPYALRRQALGIIAIILERSLSTLHLDSLIEKSVELLAHKVTRDVDVVKGEVAAFFRERLKNLLLTQDRARPLSNDTIEAVLSTDWYDLPDAVKRIEALEVFKDHPDCPVLVVAFKRVSNILKGMELEGDGPDPALFKDPEEKALYMAAEELAPKVAAHLAAADLAEGVNQGGYEGAFTTLAGLKGTIDAFFDKVMVMVDDEPLKKNRLMLLDSVRSLYYKTADLSKLVV